MANCGRMVRYGVMVTMGSVLYRKPPSLSPWYDRWSSTIPRIPSKWGSQIYRDMSNFEWPYLRIGAIRSTSCLVLGWGFRVGGSNGAISGSIKSRIAAGCHLENYSGIARFPCGSSFFVSRPY